MKRQRIIEWADSLGSEQLLRVCVNVVARMIETGDVHFPQDADRPYWESCGDSLDGELVKISYDEINEMRESLRDKFAMAALQGIIGNAMTHKQIIEQGNGLDKICEVTAKAAYEYASAMLAQRGKG